METHSDEIILLDDQFAVVARGPYKGKYGRIEEIPYNRYTYKPDKDKDQIHIRLAGLWDVRVNRDDITPITKAEFQQLRLLSTQ